MVDLGMRSSEDLLAAIRNRIAAHARPDLHTAIDGLLVSAVTKPDHVPEYSLTEPILVVMAQGGKRLRVGDRSYEYRAGDCLVVTADLPVTGHYLDVSPGVPSLSMGMVLRPSAVAALSLQIPASRRGAAPDSGAIATGPADVDLLDAVERMLRLLDRPGDAVVLSPLIEQEILWRALNGPLGSVVRQIGLPDSDLTHINRVIAWLRDHYAEPMTIDGLAELAGMSSSTLHRRFRAVTALSPLQFQKQLRLQQAQRILLTHPGDVAAAGHAVGYDSASQFAREYRRMFGTPPGRHAAALRVAARP